VSPTAVKGAMLLVCLLAQAVTIEIDGPPALLVEDSIELRADAKNAPEDAVLVWRIADAPGGVKDAIRTVPEYDERTFSVRGTSRLALHSKSTATGEGRISVSVEKGGKRLATRDFLFAVVRPITIRARLRAVVNAKGGTRRADEVRDKGDVAKLEEEVNKLLRAVGVIVDLRPGDDLRLEDDMFDADGRFHPVQDSAGRKAKTETMCRLLKNDLPGVINIYQFRELHWTQPVAAGIESVRIEHDLMGVGHQDGWVILDDTADGETLAHEFGHVFGLGDIGGGTKKVEEYSDKDRKRMMFGIKRGRLACGFTWEEFRKVRTFAEKHASRQRKAER